MLDLETVGDIAKKKRYLLDLAPPSNLAVQDRSKALKVLLVIIKELRVYRMGQDPAKRLTTLWNSRERWPMHVTR